MDATMDPPLNGFAIGFGIGSHTFEKDERRWEHARSLIPGHRPPGQGWEVVGGGWIIWEYWARRLDEPASPEDEPLFRLFRDQRAVFSEA